MSDYSRIWEKIRVVREQLAHAMGVQTSEVSRLPESIRLATDRAHQVNSLLAEWAYLEIEASGLDPDTGNHQAPIGDEKTETRRKP